MFLDGVVKITKITDRFSEQIDLLRHLSLNRLPTINLQSLLPFPEYLSARKNSKK
jgi:hypothetical protein